jgi:hypothetical protein
MLILFYHPIFLIQKARKRALEHRQRGNISSLSGGADRAYSEVSKNAQPQHRHLLFRKREEAKKQSGRR